MCNMLERQGEETFWHFREGSTGKLFFAILPSRWWWVETPLPTRDPPPLSPTSIPKGFPDPWGALVFLPIGNRFRHTSRKKPALGCGSVQHRPPPQGAPFGRASPQGFQGIAPTRGRGARATVSKIEKCKKKQNKKRDCAPPRLRWPVTENVPGI